MVHGEEEEEKVRVVKVQVLRGKTWSRRKVRKKASKRWQYSLRAMAGWVVGFDGGFLLMFFVAGLPDR